MTTKTEVDIHMLEENLKLTPEERIEKHQRALELVIALQEAKKKLNAEPSKPTSDQDLEELKKKL